MSSYIYDTDEYISEIEQQLPEIFRHPGYGYDVSIPMLYNIYLNRKYKYTDMITCKYVLVLPQVTYSMRTMYEISVVISEIFNIEEDVKAWICHTIRDIEKRAMLRIISTQIKITGIPRDDQILSSV
jgi:hypothetical protein